MRTFVFQSNFDRNTHIATVLFDRISVKVCGCIETAYLYMCKTRDELDEALEHRHVADGDQLLPDVEDYLEQGGGVLIPRSGPCWVSATLIFN